MKEILFVYSVEVTPGAIGVNPDEIIANALEATESVKCEVAYDREGTEHRVWPCSSWSVAERIRMNPDLQGHIQVWRSAKGGPIDPAPDFREIRRVALVASKTMTGSALLARIRARAST